MTTTTGRGGSQIIAAEGIAPAGRRAGAAVRSPLSQPWPAAASAHVYAGVPTSGRALLLARGARGAHTRPPRAAAQPPRRRWCCSSRCPTGTDAGPRSRQLVPNTAVHPDRDQRVEDGAGYPHQAVPGAYASQLAQHRRLGGLLSLALGTEGDEREGEDVSRYDQRVRCQFVIRINATRTSWLLLLLARVARWMHKQFQQPRSPSNYNSNYSRSLIIMI